MRVSTVNENRIDIHLSADELYDIFGGYDNIDYKKTDCRAKINCLISALVPDMFFPLDCEKILIEVRPSNPGCTISIIKQYRENESKEKTVTFIYENSNDLILSVELLNELTCKASALYTKGKKYAVICRIKPFEIKKVIHIGEYCKIKYRQIDAVIISEYWQPVCKENAVNKLARAFLQ